MSSVNEDLLSDDPDAAAIEADDDVAFEPETDSQVVAIEPPIISIGRAKRRAAMRKLQSGQDPNA